MSNRIQDAILEGKIVAQPQADEGATYAGRIKKSDGVIDWSQSAAAIDRQVRAFNPWPVAQTTFLGEQLRCWGALPVAASADQGAVNELPGKVIAVDDDGIHVQTGDGVLVITEVQAPGRKKGMSVDVKSIPGQPGMRQEPC